MRESLASSAAADSQTGGGAPLDGASEGLLCRWLSTLLGAELDEPTLARYRQGEAAPLLGYLCEAHGLDEQAGRIEAALSRLVMFTTPRLELAADFAELFLADARSGAPPYASLYLDERQGFLGAPAERMEARLAEAGFAVKREVGEPADHLAVMLDYLGHRLERLAETEGAETVSLRRELATFLEHELCSWLPRLVARSAEVRTASDLYPALLALTEAYCRRLAECLRLA